MLVTVFTMAKTRKYLCSCYLPTASEHHDVVVDVDALPATGPTSWVHKCTDDVMIAGILVRALELEVRGADGGEDPGKGSRAVERAGSATRMAVDRLVEEVDDLAQPLEV